MALQDDAPGTPGATTQPDPNATTPEHADAGADAGSTVQRFEMTTAALNARLERARRQGEQEARAKVLAELGVKSPEELQAERKRLAELQAEREKAEREKMTREEQLAKDLEAERAKRAKLEAELQAASSKATFAQEDSRITQIAMKYVAPSAIKLKAAKIAYAEYVASLTDAQRKRLNEAATDRWFRRFIKQEPDFARNSAAAAAPATSPAPAAKPAAAAPAARKPISSPTQRQAPAPASASKNPSVTATGKTPKPGLPNSMNQKELREYMAAQKISGW